MTPPHSDGSRPFLPSGEFEISESGSEQTPEQIYGRNRNSPRSFQKRRWWKGAGMAEYRVYTVGLDGHFIGFEALVSVDDTQAIDKAKRLVNGHDIELWSGARFVIRLVQKPK